MKKIFLVPFLSVAAISTLVGCNVSQSTNELSASDLDYSEIDEGVVIKGTKVTAEKKYNTEAITVPSTINGKTVLRINKGAFSGFSNLKSITLPFIGAYDHAADSEYNDGQGLLGYIFGEDNYSGGYRTNQFYSSNESSTGYSSAQFYIPQTLKNVTITNCKSIPSGSFSNCCCLNSVKFTGTSCPTTTNDIAFYGCDDLTEVVLPNSVTTIGESSFENCYSLPTIDLPKQLTYIGERAFYYCTSLDYLVIPHTISNYEQIGTQAFCDCNDYEASLRSKYNNDYPVILFESGEMSLLENCYRYARPINELYYEDTGMSGKVPAVVRPGVVDSSYPTYPVIVGFTGKYGVTSDGFVYAVCKEDGVEFAAICKYVESSNRNANILNIPYSITHDDGTIYSVREIAPSALQGLKNYDQVIIPGSVIYVGGFAFRYSKIGTLTFSDEHILSSYPLYIDPGAFSRCTIDTFDIGKRNLEYVASGTLANTSIKKIIIPSTATEIDRQAFYESSVSTVEFAKNSTLKTIGSGAFYGCENLKTITIPKSVTRIEEGAFNNCTNLQHVIFEEGSQLEYIGDDAFLDCYNLLDINLDACTKLKYIGDHAFIFCEALNSIGINANNSSLTYIGDSCFDGDLSLNDVYIPKSVTRIGDLCFHGCEGLTKLTFESNGTDRLYLGEAAFAYCTNLTKVVFPSQLYKIDNNAFRFCTNISEIKFDNSNLCYIGNLAFAGLHNLSSIELPLSLANIENHPFVGAGVFDYRNNDCKKLTITLPFRYKEEESKVNNIMFDEECWGWGGMYTPQQELYIDDDGMENDTFVYNSGDYSHYSCYGVGGWLSYRDDDTFDNGSPQYGSSHNIVNMIGSSYLTFKFIGQD